MRFSCDSCATRYSIADEKVRGKTLRVRCKKCGNSILVKEDPSQLEAAEASAPGVDEGDRDNDTTRVVKPDEVQRAMLEAGLGPQAPGAIPTGKFVANKGAARAAAPPPKPVDKKLWHAMLGGKQSGPFTRDELRGLVDSGQFTARTYVWKEGMAGWVRSKDVEELATVLGAAAEAPRAAPPPPSAPPAQAEPRTVIEQEAPAAVKAAVAAAAASAVAKKSVPAAARPVAKAAGPSPDATLPPDAAFGQEVANKVAAAKAAADQAAVAKAAAAKAAGTKAAAEKVAAEKAAEKAAAAKAAAEKAAAEKAAAEKAAAEKAAAEKAAAEKAAAEKAAASLAAAEAATQQFEDEEEATAAGQPDLEEAAAGSGSDLLVDEEAEEDTDSGAEASPFARTGLAPFSTDDEETTNAGDDAPFATEAAPGGLSVGDKTPAKGTAGLGSLLAELDVSADAPHTRKPTDADPFAEAAAKSGPIVGGAAAAPANDDPFANVPDAPGFSQPAVGETTNAIIRASGAKEKNHGKLAAAALFMVGALGTAAYLSVKYSQEFVVPEGPVRAEKPTFAKIDDTQLDQATLDVLSGENLRRAEREKVEAEARARAEAEARAKAEADAAAAKAAGGGLDDMNAMLAQDVDTEGAIKTVKADPKAALDVTPDQLALLAQLQADKARRGPAGGAPKAFVTDDAFDVKKTAADSEGGLPAEVIGKKFEEAKPGIQNCIGNAMRRNPNQKLGKVVITISIAPSGIVQAATFSNKTMADTELGTCLRTTMKRVVFPSFEGEAFDVEFPLVLGAG